MFFVASAFGGMSYIEGEFEVWWRKSVWGLEGQ